MIKILARIPQLIDAVSLYRGVGPLSALRRQYDVEYLTPNEFNWPSLYSCDLLYMVRPCTDLDRKLLTIALDYKIPVWIDYDDNILEVPTANLAHDFYSQKSIQTNVHYCLSRATVCTVSTDHLAGCFNAYRPDDEPCVVIPNAFPEHRVPLPKEYAPEKIISWRGSRTHDKDLSTAHDFIRVLLQELPDYNFVFFGEPDWRTIEMIPQARRSLVPSCEINEFFQKFFRMKPQIHFCPLEINSFNLSKSNISWIEATLAGAVTIGPRMPEWNRPGVIQSDFTHEAAMRFVEDFRLAGFDLKKNHLESLNFIRQNLFIDEINEKRADVIRWCMKISGRNENTRF